MKSPFSLLRRYVTTLAWSTEIVALPAREKEDYDCAMNRPRILMSYAQSADGRIATRTGDSRWISGPETLHLAHELRHEHDAIVVGVGTVLADNPQLTCRLPGGANPHRVVLDTALRTPMTSHMATQAPAVPTTVFCGPDAPRDAESRLADEGVNVIRTPLAGNRIRLESVLEHLLQAGLESLMVEGGAGVITSFYRSGLVDRVLLVCAPMIIGSGTEAVRDLDVHALADAMRGTTASVRQLGNDVVWEFTLR